MDLFWIWLLAQDGLGSRSVIDLKRQAPSRFCSKQMVEIARLKTKRTDLSWSILKKEILDIRRYILRNKISFVDLRSKFYPSRLKNIHDPPAYLFYKGNLKIAHAQKSVAIVGSRNMSRYGKTAVSNIVEPLARAGITIVSGLAYGIDAETHRFTFAVGGQEVKALGVLPGGPCGGYPVRNHDLYLEIMRQGLLVSEFLNDLKLTRQVFASRNRIIAGLSDAVIVIEASEKSGALITAELGLQYGRDVGAVPGNIFSQTSAGTNNLIKQGAEVIRNGWDVIEMLEGVSMNKEQISNERSILIERKKNIICKRLKELLKLNDKSIGDVWSRIIENELSLEKFASIAQVDISRIRSVLTKMEIEGILGLDQGQYIKIL